LTGIYHVMIRGIDKRNIFIVEDDYNKFLTYVVRAQQNKAFIVYAYCLMANHVHLLIKSETEDIGNIIRRITVGYVFYHNNQYGRTGHLFQNRFRSEAVQDESYFLTVARYINQNPRKAGLVVNCKDYPWSSYSSYFTNDLAFSNGIQVDFISLQNQFGSKQEFVKYMDSTNSDVCLDYKDSLHHSDEALRVIITSMDGMEHVFDPDSKISFDLLVKIKDSTKASNRQLSRVLMIGRKYLDTYLVETNEVEYQ